MSEQELNAILEEIKNRGKVKAEGHSEKDELNFSFNSAISRRSRRERLEEEEADGASPTQEAIEAPSDEEKSPSQSVEKEPSEEIVFQLTDEEKPSEETTPAQDIVFEIEEEEEPQKIENEAPVEETEPEAEEQQEEQKAELVEEEEAPLELVEIVAETEEKPKVEEPKEEDYEYEEVSEKAKSKKGLPIAAIIAAVIAVVVVVLCVVLGKNTKFLPPKMNPPAVETTEVAPVVDNSPKNPLTGESNYNENAIGKRPVAVVVENEYSTESVRPQWGLKDADIVMEGESEYSTRLLLFWADYTTVPSQVGPARSARPPFIRFSELFDAVFVHAGLSRSKGDYVGADSVFETDGVDHINLLHASGEYFDRDKSRTSTIEHTGFFVGTNAEKMLNAYDIKTDFKPENYTQFSFNDEAVDVGTTPAKEISFKWSGTNGGRCPKLGKYTYNEETKKYTTTDFDSSYGKSDVEWENLVLLLDQTTYVEKHNYKGSHTEIYCNYSLAGGKGLIASNGTAVEITWSANNGKLTFKDANGNEVKLNKGKTYIGYGSENHGGYYEIADTEATAE